MSGETKVVLDLDLEKQRVNVSVQREFDLAPITFALSFRTLKRVAGALLTAEADPPEPPARKTTARRLVLP